MLEFGAISMLIHVRETTTPPLSLICAMNVTLCSAVSLFLTIASITMESPALGDAIGLPNVSTSRGVPAGTCCVLGGAASAAGMETKPLTRIKLTSTAMMRSTWNCFENDPILGNILLGCNVLLAGAISEL